MLSKLMNVDSFKHVIVDEKDPLGKEQTVQYLIITGMNGEEVMTNITIQNLLL